MVNEKQADVLCAIKLKIEITDRLIDRQPCAAHQELAHILELINTLVTPQGVRTTQTELPLSVELENAKSLLEAAGATVHLTVKDMPRAAIESSIRQVLREVTASILTHTKSPDVGIVVTDTGINISNAGCDPAPADETRSLARVQKDIASQGVHLVTVKKGTTFVTAATAVIEDAPHGSKPEEGSHA